MLIYDIKMSYFNIIIMIYIALLILIILYFIYVFNCYNNIKSKIMDLENKNDSKIIFILDEFWNTSKYFKFFDFNNFLGDYVIDINNSSQMQYILNKISKKNIKKIDICLQSYGGNIQDNDIIVNNLLNYNGIINTFIPYYAFSAASLISLCGHNIYLNENSILGPTDPVIEKKDGSYSVNSLIQLKKEKKINKISDEILLQISDYEKLYFENKRILHKIFKRHKNNNTLGNKTKFIDNMIQLFGSGEWSHSSPFTKKYLMTKGLNINTDNNLVVYGDILNDIFNLNFYI